MNNQIMNENDLIQRFIFDNHAVRGEWVRLDHTYQTVVNQHKYPDVIRQLLGEMLVVTSLLSAMVKFKGRLTVQFQGNGKLKIVMAQCDHEFHLRGLAQFQGEIQRQELPNLLKAGQLAVTIDPLLSGKRYQGVVTWQGESLQESIEGYFRDSEQLPTRLWLAVNETNAVGLLLQVLPNQISPDAEKDESWSHLVHLTDTVKKEELLTLDPATLLSRLYAEEEVRLYPPTPASFRCNCTPERCEDALLLLGRDEVEQELKDKQEVVVTCDFCNTEYRFDRIEVARVFSKGDKPASSTQVH